MYNKYKENPSGKLQSQRLEWKSEVKIKLISVKQKLNCFVFLEYHILKLFSVKEEREICAFGL